MAACVMFKTGTGKPKGVLNLETGRKKFDLSLHSPSADLSFFIQHHWIVRWDLRGQEPYLSENLPHPCVQLVFQKGQSRIVGLVRGKFSILLEGKAQVVGVRFKPGAFYPFIQSPVSRLTDSCISFQQAFGLDHQPLEDLMFALDDQTEQVRLAENFLRQRLPEPDDNVLLVNRIIDYIIAHRDVTKVDDLARRFDIGKRTLERLFSQYVGVSPKWVIQRHRLHEATELLANGAALDWPKLALDLGYFDQAHFIKDFKTIVGMSPAEYARHIGQNA